MGKLRVADERDGARRGESKKLRAFLDPRHAGSRSACKGTVLSTAATGERDLGTVAIEGTRSRKQIGGSERERNQASK